ncbi:MAG: hypothetical protein GF372_05070 [Candidatus Marinimicrobia bacterium]|nr:hypothetical protein [Candidatus Neomarinimicrobiota bacterium]
MLRQMKKSIANGDPAGLSGLISDQPSAVNTLIPFGPDNAHQVHPLHYICDCVFEQKIDENTALQLAQILLEFGADVNASEGTSLDTPLIAACSLHCDDLALLLLRQGADPTLKGTHGGSSLHWASWTGALRAVAEILEYDIPLDDNMNEFQCTPLLWAVDGYLNARERNVREQLGVIFTLLEAGADPLARDSQNRTASDLLQEKNLTAIAKRVESYYP